MAFDLGDTVPLTFDVEGADGSTTAVLTIELPDGTPATPTPTSPSLGRYEVSFPPTQAGRHGVRWTSTAPASAHADVFDVRPAAPRYLISLADAKRHLNMRSTRTTDDEELRGHIEAATEAIELYLREAVVRRPEVDKVKLRRHTSQLMLDHRPVVSLTSVVSLDGTTTWDVADLDVDTDTGLLSVVSGPALSGTVLVTYIAGRSVIPPNYSRAAELVVESLVCGQRAPAVGPPATPGGEAELEPDDYGVVIPPKARELLGASAPLVA